VPLPPLIVVGEPCRLRGGAPTRFPQERFALKIWRFLVCLPLLAACAEKPPLSPPTFAEQAVREAEAIKVVSFAAPDGSFKGRIAARPVGDVEVQEDFYYARFDIGGENPMECSFFREEIDLATSLRQMSGEMLEIVGRYFGSLDFKQIARVDAGAIGGNPFLAVDWNFAATAEGVRTGGELKQILANKHGRSVYCAHNETGYKETFHGAFTGLLDTLEYEDESEPPPRYLEILVYSVQGQRVGIEQVNVQYDDEGDARTVVYDSMLLPVGTDELIAQDSTDVQFTTAAGELINQIHTRYQNGEPESSLSLIPGAEVGLWKVIGEYRTKKIDAIFAAPKLSSWLGSVLSLRDAIDRAGEEARVSVVQWVPDANPISPVEARAAVQEKLEDRTYRTRVEVDSLQMDAVIDREGLTRSGRMKVGPIEISVERVFAEGEVPSP
jgi:hypothetical protein